MNRAKGISSGDVEDKAVLDKVTRVKKMAEGSLIYKVGFMAVPLIIDDEEFPILPFSQHSSDLKTNLAGCERVILFAATIGSGIDRFIRRYEKTELDTALFLQGFGAERAESLANAFNADVKNAAKEIGCKTNPRFSPGFGDLPLSVQPDFLNLLDAGRRMGITLSETFLMSPSKSVTAIIGIKKI